MTNNNLITAVAIVIVAALIGVAYVNTSRERNSSQNNSEPNTQLTAPSGSGNNAQRSNPVPREVERGEILDSDMPKLEKPQMTIDSSKNYKATIATSKGVIRIDLAEKTSPATVNNFVYLANNQFYNNIIFHRIIKGFMIQGGDPTGTGAGGPGYQFDDEPFEGEYTRGTVAMANAGPNTNGSQFFIMHQDTPLPKNYVIFGTVEEGMDVVDAIAESETDMMDRPLEPTTITGVEISME